MSSIFDSFDEVPSAATVFQTVEPLCTFTSPSGTPCKRQAVDEEEYCVLHGASIIRAQEQIQRRLLALQEKSVAVLEDLMIAAFDDRVRLSAATAVLDRTGLGPKSTVVIDKGESLEHLSTEQIADELSSLAEAARRQTRSSSQKMTTPSANSNDRPTH